MFLCVDYYQDFLSDPDLRAISLPPQSIPSTPTCLTLILLVFVPSQHPVQVLLCILLVRRAVLGVLRAVLVVVITEDGHHVMVAKVDGLIHRRVSPPTANTGNAQCEGAVFTQGIVSNKPARRQMLLLLLVTAELFHFSDKLCYPIFYKVSVLQIHHKPKQMTSGVPFCLDGPLQFRSQCGVWLLPVFGNWVHFTGLQQEANHLSMSWNIQYTTSAPPTHGNISNMSNSRVTVSPSAAATCSAVRES